MKPLGRALLPVSRLTNTLFPHLVTSEARDVGDEVVSQSLAQLEPLNRNGEAFDDVVASSRRVVFVEPLHLLHAPAEHEPTQPQLSNHLLQFAGFVRTPWRRLR